MFQAHHGRIVTTVYLIRHATNPLVGNTIAGWSPGVHLNEQGRREAEVLAKQFPPGSVHDLYSSPLERATETATPLAHQLGCPIQIAPAIGEIQFGAWTGKRFSELEMQPKWQQWNRFRAGVRIPGGETMLEVQARVVGFIQERCEASPEASLALVSHGDPIRSALLYYLGMPLDLFHRIEVSPASVSVIEIGDTGARVLLLNHVADWRPSKL